MFHTYSLLLLALATGQPDGMQEKPVREGPYILRGRVVDVFDSGQVLLSIGTENGARKGLKGSFYQVEQTAGYYGTAEFMEVGAKYSVVRVRVSISRLGNLPFNPYSPYFESPDLPAQLKGRLKENDKVWLLVERQPVQVNPAPDSIREYRTPLGFLNGGGAIIDLSGPNPSKLLPK
jgi:hypothetical protein